MAFRAGDMASVYEEGQRVGAEFPYRPFALRSRTVHA